MVFSGSALASGLIGPGVLGASGGGGKAGCPLSPAGLLYGLGAGFGYGLYSILGKALLKRYGPETVSIYTFIFAAAGAALFAPLGRLGERMAHIPSAWLPALGIGIMCSMLPFLLYTKGLKQVPASKASVFASLEPVMAAAVGILAFGEMPDGGKFLGTAVTLGGIVLLEKEA